MRQVGHCHRVGCYKEHIGDGDDVMEIEKERIKMVTSLVLPSAQSDHDKSCSAARAILSLNWNECRSRQFLVI